MWRNPLSSSLLLSMAGRAGRQWTATREAYLLLLLYLESRHYFWIGFFQYTHRENGEDALLVDGEERCLFSPSVALSPALPYSASSPPTLPTVACLFHTPIVIISFVLVLCCVNIFLFAKMKMFLCCVELQNFFSPLFGNVLKFPFWSCYSKVLKFTFNKGFAWRVLCYYHF